MEVPLISWMFMFAAILVSSMAGIALARNLAWSDSAASVGVPVAFGLVSGPFILGFSVVLALGIFRSHSHAVHIGFVYTLVVLLLLLSQWQGKKSRGDRLPVLPWNIWEKILLFVVLSWVGGLFANMALAPLMQNDSLEYATVGRLLYETSDLTAYPALDPEMGSSGIYAPWTHPPLYVALIYFSYLLQGHADAPVLMRLIAPWFALVSAFLVFRIGSQFNRQTGLLAAIIFVSTPLYFLGASASLIDPLPVAGMTLMLVSVLSVKGSIMGRGLIQGLVLGAALWTHSEAILFIPLMLIVVVAQHGTKHWRHLLMQCALILLVSMLVAALPYGRNVYIFGSIIGDNPAVFRLPELLWDEYFRLSRGIDSWKEVLQYGVMKGWFAIEAYGISFWLMTLGVVIYLKRYLIPRVHGYRQGVGVEDKEITVSSMLLVIFCYIAGVVVSVLLGIDLMIRNERYWLVLMPCVALTGGWVLAELVNQRDPAVTMGRIWRGNCFKVLIVCIAVFQFSALMLYRQGSLGVFGVNSQFNQVDALKQTPAGRVVFYLMESTPEDVRVLSMKPADMFYANRRMVSYLDPRLLPFYQELDPKKAVAYLRAINIEYLHIPDYYLPPVYNSILQEILADPMLTTLEYSQDGYQIYSLGSSGKKESVNVVDMSEGDALWTEITQFQIGGRKALLKIPLASRQVRLAELEPSVESGGLFQRDWSTLFLSGQGGLFEGELASLTSVDPGREYVLRLSLEGHALVQLWLIQYDENGDVLTNGLRGSERMVPMGSMVLGGKRQKNQLLKRFRTYPRTKRIRVGVEYQGKSLLRIDSVQLNTLVSSTTGV